MSCLPRPTHGHWQKPTQIKCAVAGHHDVNGLGAAYVPLMKIFFRIFGVGMVSGWQSAIVERVTIPSQFLPVVLPRAQAHSVLH